MMFAVIRTGGKQYRVSVGDVLTLEKLDGEVGADIDFDDVLLLGGEPPTVGTPRIDGAAVQASIMTHLRGPKLLSFKRRRRKASSKRTVGHRQELTQVRVTEIRGSDSQVLAEYREPEISTPRSPKDTESVKDGTKKGETSASATTESMGSGDEVVEGATGVSAETEPATAIESPAATGTDEAEALNGEEATSAPEPAMVTEAEGEASGDAVPSTAPVAVGNESRHPAESPAATDAGDENKEK